MTWNSWLLFVSMETILCLTPGPAVLFVVAHGLARGGRSSLWANAGILSGNALYFGLSALGLGAVLLASNTVFTVITYVGSGYLLYLGIQTFRGAGLAINAEPASHTLTSGWRTLCRGFAAQTANPKALLFFVALLPQFVSPDAPILPQIFILGTTSVLIEFCVLGAYGYLAGRAASVACRPRFIKATNRASGTMLIAAGAGIMLKSNR
jgi:homoserine/homoserine lactone efflux protein